MSERGRILIASHEGTFLLRFVGDVRLTLCIAIDDYFRQMFSDPNFAAVVVDLCQAQGLDSTSLGLLVKLAQETTRRTTKKPLLVSNRHDIDRLLASVGVNELFETVENPSTSLLPEGELPEGEIDASHALKDSDERTLRARVLEAHQLLMSLNAANVDAFKDLVAQLESVDSRSGAST